MEFDTCAAPACHLIEFLPSPIITFPDNVLTLVSQDYFFKNKIPATVRKILGHKYRAMTVTMEVVVNKDKHENIFNGEGPPSPRMFSAAFPRAPELFDVASISTVISKQSQCLCFYITGTTPPETAE